VDLRPTTEEPDMIVDCATCPVRGQRCDECFVTALAGLPVVLVTSGEVLLDAAERRVVGLFVAAGLVDRTYAGSLRARLDPSLGHAQAVG
jgi:hypothetical protein